MLAPSPAHQAQPQQQPWSGQPSSGAPRREFYGDGAYGRPADNGYVQPMGPRYGGDGRYGGEATSVGAAAGSYSGEGAYGASACPTAGMPYGGAGAGAPAGGYGTPREAAGPYGAPTGPGEGYGGGGQMQHPAPQHVQQAQAQPDYYQAEYYQYGARAEAATAAPVQHHPQPASDAQALYYTQPAAAQPAHGYGAAANPSPYPADARTGQQYGGEPASGGGAAWSEHRAPDGRMYFHCAVTGATQWERPASLA